MTERVSFLFGSPRRVKISTQVFKIDVIDFDATISESHNLTAQLTDHPVELGSNITDHYRILPQSITVNGIISNNPLLGLAGNIQNITSDSGTRISSGPSDQAYDSLRNSMRSGNLLTIFTTLKEYNNMLITSVSVRRDANSGNILNSIVTLREVRIAKVKTISQPESPSDVKDNAVENKGRTEKTAANQSQSTSAASGKSAVSNPF
jgi:hypothetical protein